ncbi:MAG: D-amino acid aminotransferase [Gammaproteobacteria bacterium]
MQPDNPIVYLNGSYLPLSEAKVSVLDRGFLFGDGVYEVIPSYAGKLFRLEDHLARLDNSLNNIRLASPHSREEWRDIFARLLEDRLDQYIYLQITRGVASKRDHAFPAGIKPTVFAMSAPIVKLEGRETGVRAITIDDTRWELCHVKATTLLANILLRQQAVEKNCAEAVLIKDGYVTEGAASNVFAVLNGVLTTPPKNNEILPGITRDVILELASSNRIPFEERTIKAAELSQADEIWLTSSTREILPVVEIDSRAVADGKPGPVWKRMNEIFQEYKRHE